MYIIYALSLSQLTNCQSKPSPSSAPSQERTELAGIPWCQNEPEFLCHLNFLKNFCLEKCATFSEKCIF